SGVPPQYEARVYEWDATTKRVVGPALFESGLRTAPNSPDFTAVTVDMGTVHLQPGSQYVILFTTAVVPSQPNASFRWAAVPDTAYAGGNFVYHNGSAVSMIENAWSYILEDLAFIARFFGALSQFLPAGASPNAIAVAGAIDAAMATTTGGPSSGFSAL